MKKISALTLAAMLLSSVSFAQDDCNKECKSTWMQWFGDAALLALAYDAISARSPTVQSANIWVSALVLEAAPMLAEFAKSKFNKKTV